MSWCGEKKIVGADYQGQNKWVIKTVKGPSVTAAAAPEGHLAYQGWCVIGPLAELKWAALSHSHTGQNKKEGKKKREEQGRRTERGEAARREGGGLCLHAYQVCWCEQGGSRPPSLPFAGASSASPWPCETHLVPHGRRRILLCKYICVLFRPSEGPFSSAGWWESKRWCFTPLSRPILHLTPRSEQQMHWCVLC